METLNIEIVNPKAKMLLLNLAEMNLINIKSDTSLSEALSKLRKKEAEILANNYIAEKVVGPASLEDCHHIAIATINKVDILVSWNFKHIVNLSRIRGYNSVDMRMGYIVLEIRNPKELIEYGNN
ncbi:MAG: hypothetical protein LBG28_06625 [Tannerella sp.]|jgi:hypothetical protein|nr:hypothetical protein [Tannerella sp.]